MKNTLTTTLAALTLAGTMLSPALAQNHADHGDAVPAVPAATAAAPAPAASADAVMTAGEITRVDKRGGKLTIRHEEIKNLDMPPMTMVFGLKEAALAEQFMPGDKVRFHVQDEGGSLRITRIELAK
ncbi:Cu/Ag efflux protein CusF [Comamonas sp. BIGb0152]|uniref:copper-binding protein n=1 Tax=Comamonas sp. BIGb0152 TaxID=2940601 RepID=UPI0021675A6F|nr:copper-binding protein [Comamonas sp. BIGb0152]MCS4292505.1 Cu/Ag efflux protein CusF [Comamonas sp. BIGb0152]